jgi:hypothetical protein
MNVLRRACLFAGNQEIDGDTVRRMLAASVFAHSAATGASAGSPAAVSPANAGPGAATNSTTNLAELEKAHILAVLGQVDGKRDPGRRAPRHRPPHAPAQDARVWDGVVKQGAALACAAICALGCGGQPSATSDVRIPRIAVALRFEDVPGGEVPGHGCRW